MKLISYKFKGKPGAFRIGCIVDNKVIDLQESYRALLISKQEKDAIHSIDNLLPADPSSFFSMGISVIERAKEACDYSLIHLNKGLMFDKDEVSLSTPIPAPSKIICVGKNYAEHAVEMESDVPEFPVLFAKFNNALIGPEDDIEKSTFTGKLDYEVELAVVIGKEATHVSKEKALNYIAGYTIGNDVTARDLQKRTPQWLQGKTLDRSTPVGPSVVTTEEIPDPSNLSIHSFVNGEERQNSNTSQLIFDIPFLIEFISSLITLKPGDIILTGTPNGVGFAMNPPQFLQDGDVVTVEIEKLGRLENKVTERK
ncbi:fumarylacetoacetate hydrolase family protein [Virgibacillus necropolis]|uniref:2-hydroxyhepta-2,4-diene-1,7-dioate isomerase n=1 Tax=Virgibacillus necropolis TaxID=163877 RepID=A0A221M7H0_9BACI|nr:fumarylacetoacetate hydrolase family protein [Virgibacillus necropolis]ASN03581.1 2-hydroxyhepta-2,4-diene-1,7-dioate isomerase [Virgibacillus necropolis]